MIRERPRSDPRSRGRRLVRLLRSRTLPRNRASRSIPPQAVELLATLASKAARAPAIRVHADGARRELPARPQRPSTTRSRLLRSYDEAARRAGRRRGCATSEDIRTVCAAVSNPVNVLALRAPPSVELLSAAGVFSPHQPRLRGSSTPALWAFPSCARRRTCAENGRSMCSRRKRSARSPARHGRTGRLLAVDIAAPARRLRYSTRTTAAVLCVVSSPVNGPSNVPDVGGTQPYSRADGDRDVARPRTAIVRWGRRPPPSRSRPRLLAHLDPRVRTAVAPDVPDTIARRQVAQPA